VSITLPEHRKPGFEIQPPGQPGDLAHAGTEGVGGLRALVSEATKLTLGASLFDEAAVATLPGTAALFGKGEVVTSANNIIDEGDEGGVGKEAATVTALVMDTAPATLLHARIKTGIADGW
jgi:hypothetical protein